MTTEEKEVKDERPEETHEEGGDDEVCRLELDSPPLDFSMSFSVAYQL